MEDDVSRDAREMASTLRKFRLGLTGMVNRELPRFGINLSQYTVLSTLAGRGSMTMSELATHIGVTLGAMTNVVDKLVDSGHVDRKRGTADRRVVNVSLADKGRDTVRCVQDEAVIRLTRYFAGVKPEDRRTFLDIYDLLAERLREEAERVEPPAKDLP